MNYFILKDRMAIQVAGPLEWATWRATEDNFIVSKTDVDQFQVSTAFVGLDASQNGLADPRLFETAILSEDGGFEVVGRLFTYAEAEACHEETVTMLRGRQAAAQCMTESVVADVILSIKNKKQN